MVTIAIDAGSVFVRLGAHFTGREEFDRYDRAIDKAQQKARSKKLRAELGGDFNPHAFNQYERRLTDARHRAERQKKFKAVLGADFNASAFRSYEKALRESNVHTERATRATKEHEKSIGRLRHTIGLGLGAVGLGGLAFGLRDVAKAGLEMETSQAKVRVAVHNAGISYHRYGDEIDHALTRQALLTGFQKQDVENAFANMIRTTGNVTKALHLNALAMDIARTKGMGLQGAQSLLARVYNGNFRALTALGIPIPKVTKAQDALREKSNQLKLELAGQVSAVSQLHAKYTNISPAQQAQARAIDAQRAANIKLTPAQLEHAKALDKTASSTAALNLLQQKFQGQAGAYAKTTQGSFDRAKVAFEIMQQRLGAVLLPKLASAGTALANFFIQMDEGKGAGGRFAATLTNIANTLRPIVTWLGRAIGSVFKFTAAHTTITKIALAFAGTAFAVHKVATAVEAIRTAKSIGQLRTLLSWLGRVGRTKAGETAADEIVGSGGIGGVGRRSQRALGGIRNLWRRILGGAGSSAGAKAGDDIVASTVSSAKRTGGTARSGRLFSLGLWIGGIIGPGIVVVLSKLLADWIARQTGTKGKEDPGSHAGRHGSVSPDPTTAGGQQSRAWDDLRHWLGFQHGGVTPGGPVMVGEAGPEIIEPPRGTQVHSNRASKRLVRDMASDLMGLPKAATSAGAKTAKALEDRLTQGYKNSRKQTKAINKDVGADFEDLRKDSDRTFKRLSDRTGDQFDSIRKDSARSSTRTRDTVTDRFSDLRRDAGKHLDRLRNTAKDRFSEVANVGRRQGARLRDAIRSTMGSVDSATSTGLSYVADATNSALRSFGVKPVHLSVPKPHGFRGGGMVPAAVSPGELLVDPSGRTAKVPGPRTAADSVLTYLREGTAVLTGHGQQLVRSGASIAEAVSRQLPHFAKGGYVFPFGKGFNWGRIDMGVDMSGGGPIGAIGDAVLTRVAPQNSGTGWPGAGDAGHGNRGAMIVYQLLNGPKKGRYVYTAENIDPTSGAQAGRRIRAGTPYARARGQFPFLEMGWAQDAHGTPQAAGHADQHTAAGQDMWDFLHSLSGGPGGGGSISIPNVRVRGAGPMRALVQAALNKARRGANRYIDRQSTSMTGLGVTGGTGRGGIDSQAKFIPFWNRVNPDLRRWASTFAGIVQRESTFDPHAGGPGSGNPTHAGWYQFDSPTWAGFKPGGAPGWPEGPYNPGLATKGAGNVVRREGARGVGSRWAQTVQFRAGGHVPKRFHSANSDSRAIQTLQGRLDADDHWYQYFQQKSDIEGWNPAAKLIGLDQDEIGIMRRQERLAHRALRSLGLEHGHVSRTEGRYRKELRSDAGHISRLKRRLEDLGLPRGSSAQTRRFEQLKHDIRRQLGVPNLSKAERAHLQDELRTVGQEETAAKGGDRRRLAELKLRIRREIRKLQDRDKRIKKKLADLKKKATGGSVDASALRQMLVDLPWSIRDKQLDIEQLKKGGTGTAGGAAGGTADASGDLQAKLDQALARADMLTETVRESAAAFNVFGGPGDIGAGAGTALGAVADPFAYGGAGPGTGLYMDPTTGQVTVGRPLPLGTLQQRPPLVGPGPHQAPSHGPGWYVLKIDDPEGQKVVGGAAVGGFSSQGYRSASRERVGP